METALASEPTTTKWGVNFLSHTNDGFKATCIMEVIEEPKAVSYTRDKDGKVTDRHLNDVFNTIHTGTGGGNNTDCYIAEPKVHQIMNIVDDSNIGFKNPQRGRVYNPNGICPCLNCCEGGGLEPKIAAMRGRVGHQQANTLDTSCNQGVVANYRIRKLTPRECFRLMGVAEADIDKMLSAGISNSQLYKLAGNSIVVDVLYHIFRKMFIEKENEHQQLTLF